MKKLYKHVPGALMQAHKAGNHKVVRSIAKNMKATGAVKHTGTFQGKSNALGHGGRAAQMKAKGVPGGVIGAIARREGAAPGGPHYHGAKKKANKSLKSTKVALLA